MTLDELRAKLIAHAITMVQVSADMQALASEARKYHHSYGWGALAAGSNILTAGCEIERVAACLEDYGEVAGPSMTTAEMLASFETNDEDT